MSCAPGYAWWSSVRGWRPPTPRLSQRSTAPVEQEWKLDFFCDGLKFMDYGLSLENYKMGNKKVRDSSSRSVRTTLCAQGCVHQGFVYGDSLSWIVFFDMALRWFQASLWWFPFTTICVLKVLFCQWLWVIWFTRVVSLRGCGLSGSRSRGVYAAGVWVIRIPDAPRRAVWPPWGTKDCQSESFGMQQYKILKLMVWISLKAPFFLKLIWHF